MAKHSKTTANCQTFVIYTARISPSSLPLFSRAHLFDPPMTEYMAFFYGTLMHPKILKAVIKNDGPHLQICPAILLDHTRHKVKNEDYPGILPFSRGVKLFTHTLSREERSVRGTLVKGLTVDDMKYLDIFEGDEYVREIINAHPLGPFIDVSDHTIDDLVPSDPAPLSPDLPAIEAETYIYSDETCLDIELWSFEEFVKNNAWKWYGGTR